jgi:hypothetical protein
MCLLVPELMGRQAQILAAKPSLRWVKFLVFGDTDCSGVYGGLEHKKAAACCDHVRVAIQPHHDLHDVHPTVAPGLMFVTHMSAVQSHQGPCILLVMIMHMCIVRHAVWLSSVHAG